MSRKRKMTPAEKASARWDDGEDDAAASVEAPKKSSDGKEPLLGTNFVISLALIGVVSVASIVIATMQGNMPV